VLAIVQQSMTWRRGKGNPLTRAEIDRLNALLPGFSFKIPELLEREFLDSLDNARGPVGGGKVVGLSEPTAKALVDRLLGLGQLKPQDRGLQFEGFLTDCSLPMSLHHAVHSALQASRSTGASG
jgi:hypothetical protein